MREVSTLRSKHRGKFIWHPCSRCGQMNRVVSPEWLRWRREEAGLSGVDVARRVSVSPAFISDIERGLKPVPVNIAKFYESL